MIQRARKPRARLTSVLLGGLLLACSPGGGGGDAGGPAETFTIGEDIDASSCEEHVDCPLGFECRSGRCRAVDADVDNDGYTADVDCDDNDPSVNPGALEVCDGIDNNCNGEVDEGVKNACGYCGPVPEEICDGIDNDCDGLVDEDCVAGTIEEQEPNDGAANCQPIGLPPNEGEASIITGAFNPPGDKDSFCFFARAGTELLFELASASLGADTDAVLSLFDADGLPLPGGYNDYAGGPDPRLPYTFAANGNVRLDVYNFDADRGGPGHIYELRIVAVSLVECLDEDGDGVSVCDGDCDDSDPLIFPNQTEVCDGVDNNCNGEIDEGCPDLTRVEREPNDAITQCELMMPPFTVKGVINPRKDRDTFCFFAPQGMVMGFDIDAKESSPSLLNSKVTLYGMPEQQIAQNRDGVDPITGYTATASDSYLEHTFVRPGVYAIRVEDESALVGGIRHTYTLFARVLASPECTDNDSDGVSTCEGDCDDNDPTVHFGAIEICDGKDNNCDGVGDPGECTGDFDGDGYSGLDGDCDDTDPNVHPGAVEICDGIDNNCDGQIDEGVKNACGGCGFAPPEICGDGIDNDCDGSIDEPECSQDSDGDGYSPDQGDCDDSDPNVHPGAVEICDGIDNNCNGLVDEYVKNSCGQCAPEPEEICDGIDNNCNGIIDDGVLNDCGYCGPTPEEICDGIDNNCDGQIDEGLLNACGECGEVPAERCDGVDNNCDGVIDEGCDVDLDGDGMTPRQGDCDDDDPAVYWGAPELCGDGKDNNCNGFIDEPPACPAQAESEPNNTIASCDPLLWPGQLDGVVASLSDIDTFCFTTTVPDTELGFDIDARALGSPLDSFLRVLRPDGASLATNNSGTDPQSGQAGADSYLVYKFAQPGPYVLQVSASSIAAGVQGPAYYELHVLPVSGCLDLDGDGIDTCSGDCDDFNASVHPGAVDICDEEGIDHNCSGVANEQCVGLCYDDAFKGNNSFAGAHPVTPGVYADLMYCGGAFDFFRIPVAAGETLSVDISFIHAEANLALTLHAPDGTPIATSNTEANNESAAAVATTSGDHFIQVSGPLNQEGAYEMAVTVTP